MISRLAFVGSGQAAMVDEISETRDMTAKTMLFAFCALFTLGGLGCGPRYVPLTGHTIQAGENQQRDVVWVSERGEIIDRCSNSTEGPICVTADIR